jgi:hypothetical protein
VAMLKFSQFLFEKRSPKSQTESAYSILKQYANDPDIYISFTRIDKIGINPGSKFNTPNGVYCYPLKEYFDKHKTESPLSDIFPFASSAPYVNIIKKSCSKFIDNFPIDYSQSDLDKDIISLKKEYDKFDLSKIKSVRIRNLLADKKQAETIAKQIKLTPSDKLRKYWDIDRKIKRIDDEITLYKNLEKKSAGTSSLKSQTELKITQLEKELVLIQKLKILIQKLKKAKTDLERYAIVQQIIKPDMAGGNIKPDVLDAPGMLKLITDIVKFQIKRPPAIKKEIQILKNDLTNISTGIDFVIDVALKTAKATPAWQFWNVTRWIANGGTDPDKEYANDVGQNWNNILRKLGYCGFADKSGIGIIHKAEPIQAVFFSRNAFKFIDRIKNNPYTIKIESIQDFFYWLDEDMVFDLTIQGKSVKIVGNDNTLWGTLPLSDFQSNDSIIKFVEYLEFKHLEVILADGYLDSAKYNKGLYDTLNKSNKIGLFTQYMTNPYIATQISKYLDRYKDK